jgi:carboxymethylenebutenolidase
MDRAQALADHTLDVATAEGSMRVYRVRPEGGQFAPAVLMYMDAIGFREELRGLARLVAQHGYDCWLPDLYYRDGGPSFNARTPSEDFEKFAPLMRKVTREVALADTAAVLLRMDADPLVARGPKGCVGFCMGGRLALWAAASFPEQFAAAASLHGGQLGSDAPDSPHRYAGHMRCEIYLGHASDDPLMPAEQIRALERALRDAGVAFVSEVHAGAQHGYMFPERFCYAPIAAQASWQRVFALFARRLG